MKFLTTLMIVIGVISFFTFSSSKQATLNAVYDYYEGLRLAQEENKPIFLLLQDIIVKTTLW